MSSEIGVEARRSGHAPGPTPTIGELTIIDQAADQSSRRPSSPSSSRGATSGTAATIPRTSTAATMRPRVVPRADRIDTPLSRHTSSSADGHTSGGTHPGTSGARHKERERRQHGQQRRERPRPPGRPRQPDRDRRHEFEIERDRVDRADGQPDITGSERWDRWPGDRPPGQPLGEALEEIRDDEDGRRNDEQPVDTPAEILVGQDRPDDEVGRHADQQQRQRFDARCRTFAGDRRDRVRRDPGGTRQQEGRSHVDPPARRGDPRADGNGQDQDLVEDPGLRRGKEVRGAAEEGEIDEEQRDDDPDEGPP